MMHGCRLGDRVAIVTGWWIGRPFFMGNAQSTSAWNPVGASTSWRRLLAVTGSCGSTGWWPATASNDSRPCSRAKRDWSNLMKQIRFYMFIPPKEMPSYIGHNPMAQLHTRSLMSWRR
jgi:Ni,Fe-hydrogenase I cytochrome b subunit